MKNEETINAIVNYRNSLDNEDKNAFDKLINYAKVHAKVGGSSQFNVLETMLMGIVLEQQKEIHKLKLRLS